MQMCKDDFLGLAIGVSANAGGGVGNDFEPGVGLEQRGTGFMRGGKSSLKLVVVSHAHSPVSGSRLADGCWLEIYQTREFIEFQVLQVPVELVGCQEVFVVARCFDPAFIE